MNDLIEVSFPGEQQISAVIDGKVIKTEKPKEMGGEGVLPEPFTLFLVSIATCAGMYALGFCQSRGLSTQGMSLTMVSEKNDQTNRYEKMTLKLALPDGFPEKYKRPILRTMDQCIVKKYILDPPEFILETG